MVILPKEAAPEFAAFCTRNPKFCPILEITPPGDPEPVRSAPGADLRTDLPGYRVYRQGELVEQRGDIRDLWRDDLVAFLGNVNSRHRDMRDRGSYGEPCVQELYDGNPSPGAARPSKLTGRIVAKGVAESRISG